MEHLYNGLLKPPLWLETEGISRKQRAPRKNPSRRCRRRRRSRQWWARSSTTRERSERSSAWLAQTSTRPWPSTTTTLALWTASSWPKSGLCRSSLALLCTHGAAEFPTAKEVVNWIKETAKQSEGAGRTRTRGLKARGVSSKLKHTKQATGRL